MQQIPTDEEYERKQTLLAWAAVYYIFSVMCDVTAIILMFSNDINYAFLIFILSWISLFTGRRRMKEAEKII